MISSVGDFLNIVDKIYPHNENVFFRGVSSHKHSIVSALCRFLNDNSLDHDDTDVAEELFESFKNKLPSYPEFSILKNYSINDVDVLMTAQHYGMPTRLIDLTKNPLVALYFAVESYKEKKEKEKEDNISIYLIKDTAKRKIKLKSSDSIIAGFELEEDDIRHFYNVFFENDFLINAQQCSLVLLSTNKEIKSKLQRIKQCLKSVLLEKEFFSHKEKYLLPACDNEHKNYIDAFDLLYKELSNIISDEKSNLGNCDIFRDKVYKYLASWSCNQTLNPVMRELYGNDFIVIEPLPVNNRIKNQQGFFLFSKKIKLPEVENDSFKEEINIICDSNKIPERINDEAVVRIDISCKFVENLGKELEHYGVKKSFIYPELASFSEEQKAKFVQKK